MGPLASRDGAMNEGDGERDGGRDEAAFVLWQWGFHRVA